MLIVKVKFLGDIMKVRLNFHHNAEVLEPIKQPLVVGCLSKISQKKLPMGMVDLYKDGACVIFINLWYKFYCYFLL